MKFNNLYKSLLEQNESFMFTARNIGGRQKRYEQIAQQQIQDYIKNGSKGDLNLTGMPIKSLPDGLKISSNLKLSNSSIETLPPGLIVHGDLYLNDTNIKTLPKRLKVGGWLNLMGSAIETLPKDLRAGVLYLPYTPISKKYTPKQLKQMLPKVMEILT